LGGIVLMLEDEMLDPVVNVFVNYALRCKDVKAAVGEVKPKSGELVPTYVGNLQLAQKTHELNSAENSLNFATSIAANGQKLGLEDAANVLDNFDFDKIVRTRHRLVGASDMHLKNKEEVEAIRRKREQAREEAAQAQLQKEQAEIQLQQAKAAAQVGRASEAVDPSGMGGITAAMGGLA